MTTLPPFHNDSLTGFELELLAPPEHGRLLLAESIAARIAGSIIYGFKYSSEGKMKNGRPNCRLLPAFRVIDPQRQTFVTIVDDTTIQKDLVDESDAPSPFAQLVIDDLRLALWFERHSWSPEPSLNSTLQHASETFEAQREIQHSKGSSEASDVLRDPYGNTLAVVSPYPAKRMRVCEIVTRPLRREERTKVLHLVCEAAQELGCTIPVEAGLHTHFDAQPWQTTPHLCALIDLYHQKREAMLDRLQPNPLCRNGPMNPNILRVAHECPPNLAFKVLSTALQMAGVSKYADLNIKWAIHNYPRFPTIEFRAYPMTLQAEAILANVQFVEEQLLQFWQTVTM